MNSKRDTAAVGRDAPPPAFYRTFVRPDPDRPYSRVILVAMDMRQLDLAMEAGTEDPKPLTGGHGPGRSARPFGGEPCRRGVQRRVQDGARQLRDDGEPAHPLAAPAERGDGRRAEGQRVGFGTWADTHDVTGIQGVPDEDIVSFRQNLDPLVDNGEVNPMGRAMWGYTLPGSGMQTEQSGICVTESGHVLYAWGDDVSGTALGKALKAAGCTYALHLDMNPHHTGFIFSKITELHGHNYRSELLTPLMTVSPDRYIEYAPKDFFYVLLHDGTPAPVSGATFRPDPGAQPPPVWAPAIWSSTLDTKEGPVSLHAHRGGASALPHSRRLEGARRKDRSLSAVRARPRRRTSRRPRAGPGSRPDGARGAPPPTVNCRIRCTDGGGRGSGARVRGARGGRQRRAVHRPPA